MCLFGVCLFNSLLFCFILHLNLHFFALSYRSNLSSIINTFCLIASFIIHVLLALVIIVICNFNLTVLSSFLFWFSLLVFRRREIYPFFMLVFILCHFLGYFVIFLHLFFIFFPFLSRPFPSSSPLLLSSRYCLPLIHPIRLQYHFKFIFSTSSTAESILKFYQNVIYFLLYLSIFSFKFFSNISFLRFLLYFYIYLTTKIYSISKRVGKFSFKSFNFHSFWHFFLSNYTSTNLIIY